MPIPDNITEALKDLLAGLSPNSAADPKGRDGKKGSGSNASGRSGGPAGADGSKDNGGGINPSQILIISALLTGVLQVTSVLVDRNQTILIILAITLL